MSHWMNRTRTVLVASASLIFAATCALGQVSADRIVIDAQLGRRLVTDVRFEPDRLVFLSGGREERVPLDGSVVALVEPSGVAPRPRDGWVELTDGQRFVGLPVFLTSVQSAEFAAATEDMGLAWSTPLLGNLRVPLDALRRVVLKENAPPVEHDELNDVLLLTNGDRTKGLLERVWPDVVLEVDGRARSFEFNAIASITLANPDTSRVGSRVWLSDGSIVAADRIETVADGVRLDLADPVGTGDIQPAALTMNEVLAVAFESGGVLPLADLGPPQWRALSGWTLRPVMGDPNRTLLGSAEVELIGPVAASWALPSTARRVAVRVRLREDCRVWGDCEVTVRLGDGVALTERLRGERPEATFTINLPADATASGLEVLVEEGQGGAIQDRVMLDGFVLVSSEAG